MKIGFLYNHDALHQIAHTAPVAAALAARGADVTILASSLAQQAHVRTLLPPNAAITFVGLDLGWRAAAIDAVARQIAPYRRLAILAAHRAAFAALDALVVPETTSALLRQHLGLARLKLIYIPHGAGDRAIGFRAVTRQFDLVLVAGRKIRDRMRAAGLVQPATCNGDVASSGDLPRCAIVGYPKFDTVDLAATPAFFGNDRPTVLYNPHFDPELSSWYDHGVAILEWFAAQTRFNLIFAPHVMLFQRRLHASVEHRRVRLRRAIPAHLHHLPHIRIDTGSTLATDMSYTRAADIYLGDASSQVYEWILRPRPCILLVTRPAAPPLLHHQLGETITGIAQLASALERASAAPARHRQRQIELRDETFDMAGGPAGERAADAILAFLAAPSAGGPA